MNVLVANWLDRENPEAGGAELHLHQVFGRIARSGHRVAAVTSGWGGGEPTETELDGISVRRVGSRYSYPLHVRRAALDLIRTDEVDLLVEDLNKVPVFAPLWSPVPVVLLVHHLFGETAFHEASFPLALATWTLERPLGRLYRRIPTIAVSESTAADLGERGIDDDCIRVVHNGVDLDWFRPVAEKTPFPSLLYLGRLKRYKRLDLVLDALARIRASGLDARLRIAGTGDAEPALREHMERLGVGDAVEFRGFVSEEEKRVLLSESWIHVLMSEKEGWGLTNVEAAACGTPTVASDSPGLRDSVRHGWTGLLVRHGDVAELTEALGRVLGDEAVRADLSRGAREFAGTLSWDESAARVSDILARVLADSGA